MVGTFLAWKDRDEAVERAWRDAEVNVFHIGGCGSVVEFERECTEDDRKGSVWSRSVFMDAISVSVDARRRNRVLESYAWMSTAASAGVADCSGSLSSDSEPGGVDGSSSWPS